MKNIINLNETKGDMAMDQKKFDEVEKIRLTRDTRVTVKGEDEGKLYKANDIVEVAGNDKVQLLGSRAGIREGDEKAKAQLKKDLAEKERIEEDKEKFVTGGTAKIAELTAKLEDIESKLSKVKGYN